MIKNLFLLIIGVCAFIIFVGLMSQGKIKFLNNLNYKSPSSAEETKIINIGSTKIAVEVANTNEERAKGLSGRESLGQNNGMLFVFKPRSRANFWMKDTKIPLDFIWIRDGKIVNINKNVQPEPNKIEGQLQVYPSPGEIDYVIEVNANFSSSHKIKIGDSVSIPSTVQ